MSRGVPALPDARAGHGEPKTSPLNPMFQLIMHVPAHLPAQVRASEESHSGAEASLRSQMHALAMEHTEQIAQLKQQ